jgi:DNA-3-methyladenine glycosylase
MSLSPLAAEFYQRPVLDLARDLLGTRLVRLLSGDRIAGYIIETEAYQGENDLACHARAGRTARTEVMYGPAGRAYVYFIYGIHWMLNCVAGPQGFPAAVLIRAILPCEGLNAMVRGRGLDPANGTDPSKLADGPARLCQALHIDGHLNGADLTDPGGSLVIEAGCTIADKHVIRGPRVGIQRVPEPWRSIPWRLRVDLQTWNLPSGVYRV